MFVHRKEFLQPVKVKGPNPQFAQLLIEQYGGADGELSAGSQYINQSFMVQDQKVRDLLLDIGTEELGHLEMVGTAIQMLGGGKLYYRNSPGATWTASYVAASGDIIADLYSNVASELRAKRAYERLHEQCPKDDPDLRQMLEFLISREEAHASMFKEAVESLENTGVMKDFGDTRYAREYFDMSQPH